MGILTREFKEGDIVSVAEYHGEHMVSASEGGEVRLSGMSGRYSFGRLTLIKRVYNKKVDIGGYNCTVKTQGESMTIAFRGYIYNCTYFGNANEFITANTNIISGYFATKVDEEVQGIMNEFTASFSGTIEKLKKVVLPHTKDFLLSTVIGVFKKNISKVAELFDDVSIKSILINVFK